MAFRNNRRNTTGKRVSPEQLTNEISQLAYQYYVDSGYQSGSDMDNWLKAERTIKSRYNLD